MQDVRFDDLVKPTIDDNANVTLTVMNHIFEVQYMERVNSECPIVVLDKNHYYVKDTGETKEFVRSEIKNNYCSLRKTFKRLRYLINNNFVGEKNELFITLTYAENMRDTKRLYSDFDNFRNKLKYHFKDNKFDYLSIVEPQGRGAWHIHMLVKFEKQNTYIDNAWLREKWGHGFVSIRRLKNVDNIGAYMTAYLSDLDISNCLDNDLVVIETALADGGEVVEKDMLDFDTCEVVSKKVIKGGRLHLYPAGLNLYRKSKGIEYPERWEVKYKEIKNAVPSEKKRYSKGIELLKSDEHLNTIIYEEYNMKM